MEEVHDHLLCVIKHPQSELQVIFYKSDFKNCSKTKRRNMPRKPFRNALTLIGPLLVGNFMQIFDRLRKTCLRLPRPEHFLTAMHCEKLLFLTIYMYFRKEV